MIDNYPTPMEKISFICLTLIEKDYIKNKKPYSLDKIRIAVSVKKNDIWIPVYARMAVLHMRSL